MPESGTLGSAAMLPLAWVIGPVGGHAVAGFGTASTCRLMQISARVARVVYPRRMSVIEYPPRSRAPAAGTYGELNVFGSRTGTVVVLEAGEPLPSAPRGFTWRLLADCPPAAPGTLAVERPGTDLATPLPRGAARHGTDRVKGAGWSGDHTADAAA